MLKLSRFTNFLAPAIRLNKIYTNLAFRFASEPQHQKASKVPPLKVSKQQQYTPNRKLQFRQGRRLLYLNHQNITTPFLLDIFYVIPISYVGYLIANNPFYLTVPAALPLMFIVETILLLWWFQHKSFHKKHIERIYLLSSGNQIQVIFANKVRRMLKKNRQSAVFSIQSFAPIFDKDARDGKVKPYPGTRFPTDVNILASNAPQPSLLQYGWTLRDFNLNTYVLPAKYDYADWEILTKVLNGMSINIQNKEEIDKGYQYGNFPTIEQQQKHIRQQRQKQLQSKQAK